MLVLAKGSMIMTDAVGRLAYFLSHFNLLWIKGIREGGHEKRASHPRPLRSVLADYSGLQNN